MLLRLQRRLRAAVAMAAPLLFVASGKPVTAKAHHSASRTGSFFSPRYAACRSELTVSCVGALASDRAIAALRVEPGADGSLEPGDLEAARDAAVAAVYYDLQDARPHLRKLLTIRVSPKERGTHSALTKNGLRAEAAYALAHLGDRSSAADILALVEDFEEYGHGSLWIDTLEALAVLDRGAAADYVRGFIRRRPDLADFRTSMPGGTSKERALAFAESPDTDLVAELTRLTDEADVPIAAAAMRCRLLAARLRAGDRRLRADVRKTFAGSYSGTWVATCDNALLGEYGDDPRDAGILVRHLGRPDVGMDHGMANTAYLGVLRLVAEIRRTPGRRGAAGAKRILLRGLRERSSWPHLTDPAHRNFSAHYVTLHDAALAGLGDEDALLRLGALLEDPQARNDTVWLAAEQALLLELPQARDRVASLMRRAVGSFDRHRSGVFEDLRLRVLDQFLASAPDDPRWTVMLVDANADVRERTLYKLSRLRPPGACEAVVDAASDTTREAAEAGLTGLTTLGTRCRSALEAVAQDPAAPSKTRGMALEMLAAMSSPLPEQLADEVVSQNNMGPYVDRALRIATMTRSGRTQ